MLQHTRLTGGACFGEDPLTISDLQTVNFFFGPNGSGKTTISRAFAGEESLELEHTWSDSVPMTPKVYNRDFVDHVLRETGRIPGVFVLGEKSVEAEERLDAIEKEGGERDRAKDRLGEARSSLADAKGRRDEAYEKLKQDAWEKYKALVAEHGSLSPAFRGKGGVGNDRGKLVDGLLAMEAPSDDTSAPSVEDLLESAAAIFDDDATARIPLPTIPSFAPNEYDGYDLLNKSVVGSSDVTLSELVEHLGNSDWVSEGRKHLHRSGGVCPFCQQQAPKDLASQLAALFDDDYNKRIAKLNAFTEAYREWADVVLESEEGFDEDSKALLDPIQYRDGLSTLTAAIARNKIALDEKERTPSKTVGLTSVEKPVDDLNQVIADANIKIEAHNTLLRARREERPKLITSCWRYLGEVLLRDELSVYRRGQKGRDTGVEVMQGRVEEATSQLLALDNEIRELQRSVESTRPVIDEINTLLRRSGFTSFEIVESEELEHGYMLSRDGVALHERSLSEGERTFIAFLYYVHSLDGRDDLDTTGRLVAVIDDPISSLDSDILFLVGALVRRLINRVMSGSDRIGQVIVLTHNIYFHKEVTHLKHRDSGSGRAYYLIRKHQSAPSAVERHFKNPISTEYQRLWGEVRRAVEGESMSVVGLENILRRILESYFRIMGNGIWEDELAPLLSAAERPVLQSLFNWVNEGSHAVFEDVHYSPGPISNQTYLDVFRRVFEKAHQEAHYKMMLYGKESLNLPSGAAIDKNVDPSAPKIPNESEDMVDASLSKSRFNV